MWKFVINAALTIVSIAYPILWLWQGQHGVWLQKIPLILTALWLAKSYWQQGGQRYFSWLIALILLMVAINRSLELMYWYPVLINAMLLIVFVGSLFSSQSIIERLARLQTPDLPAHAISYTRKVTQVWSGVFVFNILICSLLIALQAYDYWAYYSGVISYVIMGSVMAIEFLIRQKVKQRNE